MPSFSILYPGLQSHTYEPGVLIQDWLHPDTRSVHSSISNEQMKNMYISITLDLLFQSEKLRKCTDRGCQARIQGRWNGWIFTPLFLSPIFSFLFSYPSTIGIIFDFSDIITKIHPPFQNPGSALGCYIAAHWHKIYLRVLKLNTRRSISYLRTAL